MREDVIFEVTKDHLQSGLKDVPVGFCSTSYVDPKKGLLYAGKPISELVDKDFMEVVYLLYEGKEASKEEIAKFQVEFEKRKEVKKEVLDHLKALSKNSSSLELLSIAFLILGSLEKTGDYKQDFLNIFAKLPYLVSYIINIKAGWEEKKSSGGYIESFVNSLGLENKDGFLDAFKLFAILYLDNEGGALESFVGKAVASSNQSLYHCLAASCQAFSGELNGFSINKGMEFIKGLLEAKITSEESIERKLEEKVEGGIFGFGHPTLEIEDTRATILYDYAKKHFPHHPLIRIAFLLRSLVPKASKGFANIDAISGAALVAAGFDHAEYFPLLVFFVRCIGVSIQIVHEKGGKKVPLFHPYYFYRAKTI